MCPQRSTAITGCQLGIGNGGAKELKLAWGRIRTPLLAVWKVGPLITVTTRTFPVDRALHLHIHEKYKERNPKSKH